MAETGVFVAVPDHPGELARLFADVGEIGVNVEDVRIDHDPGRPVGLVELTVAADRAEHLLPRLGGQRVVRAPVESASRPHICRGVVLVQVLHGIVAVQRGFW